MFGFNVELGEIDYRGVKLKLILTSFLDVRSRIDSKLKLGFIAFN
jgi:hypothetical protein